MRETRTNYTVVQALRGISCLWLLLHHAAVGGHVKSLVSAAPVLFQNGKMAVAVFFTLSGFVIAHSLAGYTVTPRLTDCLLLRRTFRLVPVYWASIALAVGFAGLSALIRQDGFQAENGWQIATRMLDIGTGRLEPAHWTPAYQILFYLIFALLLATRSRWTDISALAMAMAGAHGMFEPDGIGLGSGHWLGLLAPLWSVFYIGALARMSLDSRGARISLLVLGIALMAGGGFERIAAIVALFLFLTASSGWAETGLRWRWLQFLGAISYSLYLVHESVTEPVGLVAHRLFGDGPAADLIALTLILTAAIAVAALFWWTIERPVRDLSHRIALRSTSGESTPLAQVPAE